MTKTMTIPASPHPLLSHPRESEVELDESNDLSYAADALGGIRCPIPLESRFLMINNVTYL